MGELLAIVFGVPIMALVLAASGMFLREGFDRTKYRIKGYPIIRKTR